MPTLTELKQYVPLINKSIYLKLECSVCLFACNTLLRLAICSMVLCRCRTVISIFHNETPYEVEGAASLN